MNFKGNYMNPALLVAGIFLGVIGANWSHTMNKGMSAEPEKHPNDVRIEQHAKCVGAGMGSRLDEKFNIICEPNEGMDRIKDYWDKKRAQYLVDKNEGKLPKKDPNWPENPNSFETKSKRTE